MTREHYKARHPRDPSEWLGYEESDTPLTRTSDTGNSGLYNPDLVNAQHKKVGNRIRITPPNRSVWG